MQIVTTIAPIILALIMFALGLGLSIDDFKRVLKFPKDFLVGITFQIVILPIVAFIIVMTLDLSLPISIGLMIIAAAPGGVTSNALTKFANGDVALSVSLTAVTSLISIVSVPFIVVKSSNFLGSSITQEFSMVGIALKMALVVTIPVILGMIVRVLAKNLITSKINLINKTTGFLFILVFLAILIEENENILIYFKQAGLSVLILNITMMCLSYFVSKKLVSGIAQQKCISLECGLQNGTLAIFVATMLFDDVAFLVPSGAYAITMYITGFIFIYILKKSN
tara:strand:+ start:6383 stop:7228 length:846 start_codon:yes stop_codon:yes gene_type:complete